MAKYLNTSTTHYSFRELIKGAQGRFLPLILIFKRNDFLTELHEGKHRLKIIAYLINGSRIF